MIPKHAIRHRIPSMTIPNGPNSHSVQATPTWNEGTGSFWGTTPAATLWYETVRNFVKIEHTFDDDSTGYLQWTETSITPNSPLSTSGLPQKITSRHNSTERLGNHELSVGGNACFTRISSEKLDAESLTLQDAPFDETTTGLFIIDRFQATDQLSFEGQFRSDWYSGTHQDLVSRRITALLCPGPNRKECLSRQFCQSLPIPVCNSSRR